MDFVELPVSPPIFCFSLNLKATAADLGCRVNLVDCADFDGAALPQLLTPVAMSQASLCNSDPSGSVSEVARASGLRVDPAHLASPSPPEQALAAPPRTDPTSPSGPAALSGGSDTEQLFEHARQLATHLRSQHEALDHREALLNAHIAQLENELRAARIILRSREEELEGRGHQLKEQSEELGQQASAIAAAEASIKRDEEATQRMLRQREKEIAELTRQAQNLTAEISLRERTNADLQQALADARRKLRAASPPSPAEEKQFAQAWEAHERELAAEREELQQERRRLSREAETIAAWAKTQTAIERIQEGEAKLAKQRQALDDSTARLAEWEQSLAMQREQLAHRREQIEGDARQQRGKLAQRQREAEGDFARRRQSLDRMAESLEQRRIAVESMQADVLRLHRESLEMRLATEELFSQLSGRMSAARLTQSLSQIRARLADHYRMQHEDLAEQKHEIQTLTQRLETKRKSVERRKAELQEWVANRCEEVETQAARLVAREQELESQQIFFEQARDDWEAERQALQREVRRLTARLTQRETLAVV